MAPEPNRERSLRISSTLVGLEIKLPAPLDKAADTPLPSWVEIQWPAGGGAQGQPWRSAPWSAAPTRSDPDANGMRSRTSGADLRRRRIRRRATRRSSTSADRSSAWIWRAGCGSSPPTRTPSHWRTICARQAQGGGARLPGPGFPRCLVGSGRPRRATCGLRRRRPERGRHHHRAARRGFDRALESAIRPAAFDVAAGPESPHRRRAQPRAASSGADPRAMPTINFHAANVDLGRAAVRRRARRRS